MDELLKHAPYVIVAIISFVSGYLVRRDLKKKKNL